MTQNSNIYRMVRLTIFGIFLFLTLSSPAIEVGWHPSMTIGINTNDWYGDGVQLNQQQSPKFPEVVELSPTAVNLNNGWQNEIVSFAQHKYDMVKTIDVNSSVSMDSLFANGTINFSFFDQQKFDANDLNFVFTKTRDFGTTLYSPLGFSSMFTNEVGIFQQTLQGEPLHARITSTFGTHYVRGYESQAFVVVVYTFHYSSAS